MITATQQRLLCASGCEIRFDNLSRQMYATDASIYQVEPVGVAFPKSAEETCALVKAAAETEVPLIPRGSGTGLAGGAIGPGLVIDFGRYNRQIAGLDPERASVRVAAGVILDQLNAFLQSHGFCFGPDVATSSRASLGGMIANNSSGARAPVYGTTADHVLSLDIVLPDGEMATVGLAQDALPEHKRAVDDIVGRHADIIRARCPEGLVKRLPGYGLGRYLRHRPDLVELVAGSEGTLACIWSAELRVVPPPKEKGVGLIFFDSVQEALRATVELLDLKPAAIEHIDRVVFDGTRNQHHFQAVRDLLELDEKPCEAILLVEFYDDVRERLEAVRKRDIGTRRYICKNNREMALVWDMRKAGLSLLTGCKGPAKPIAGLEDVAVRPDQLPAYCEDLAGLLEPLGFGSSFYGHAAAGLVHVRPIVDLHDAADIAKFRELARGVSALTRKYSGSLAGEHGVGMARVEFMEEQLGPELLHAMDQVKKVFDPKGRMNPGKVLPTAGYTIDKYLRWGAGYAIKLPFEPVLAFAAKDESFVGNLEQCNGCGACRKDAPTMCPTFMATGEEIMSTRGRANVIRAVLDGRLDEEALGEALNYCLSCKGCEDECPSNVNLALLKAELLYARQRRDGLTLLDRLVSRVDMLGKLGCFMPRLANAGLRSKLVRKGMEQVLGLTAQRPLPPFASERLDKWFAARPNGSKDAPRGRVVLWDDCFARYYEPEIGKAAVRVLESAGYDVALPEGHKCCGRPAFSRGRLDTAREMGTHNVELLTRAYPELPVVFLEPSCYSMFAADYRELQIDGAEKLSERCVPFEQFIHDLLEQEPGALTFHGDAPAIGIHAHCHAKVLTDTGILPRLAAHIPNCEVKLLDTGCCGMAGAYGALRSNYELSLAVAKPLIEQIDALPGGARVVASGTSCRHQIEHLTSHDALHMAQVLEAALAE